MADDDMVMIRGAANTRAVSVLLRGANDYMLDEMDRSLHDAFCVVKRVLESGKVVPGATLMPLTSCLCSADLSLRILRSSFQSMCVDDFRHRTADVCPRHSSSLNACLTVP